MKKLKIYGKVYKGDIYFEVEEHKEGNFVKYEDVQKLEEQNKELSDSLEKAIKLLHECGYYKVNSVTLRG